MCSDGGTALATVRVENDRVKVTEWRFPAKGCNTGWHRHGFDYVVVPLFDGFLEIRTGDGQSTLAPMTNGLPYFRKAGVEHDVLNANDFDCAFIEIELLQPAP